MSQGLWRTMPSAELVRHTAAKGMPHPTGSSEQESRRKADASDTSTRGGTPPAHSNKQGPPATSPR